MDVPQTVTPRSGGSMGSQRGCTVTQSFRRRQRHVPSRGRLSWEGTGDGTEAVIERSHIQRLTAGDRS